MMVSREGKDTGLQLEKRTEASRSVILKFTDYQFEGFQVYDEDGIKTHVGKIDLTNPLNETCDCDSFLYGMLFRKISEDSEKIESLFVNQNGHAFQCKHIIRAKYYRTFKPKGSKC